MTIVLRSEKGSALTSAEVDGNFTDLDTRVAEIEENPPAGVSIVGFSVTGRTFKVNLSNGSEFGPYMLPVAAWAYDTGGWVPGTTYQPLTVFSVPEFGIYLVLEEYTAPLGTTEDPAVFDPDVTNTEATPLLQLLLGIDDLGGGGTGGGGGPYSINTVTDGDYTLGGYEPNWWLRFDSGSDVQLEVPAAADMSEGFAEGFSIQLVQVGEGPLSVDPAPGVAINGGTVAVALRGKGSRASLVYLGGDAWDLVGDLKQTVAFEIVPRTSADYTINGLESQRYVRMDSGSAQAVLLPLEADTPGLLPGHHVTFRQAGPGVVSVQGIDFATTINTMTTLDSAGEGATFHVLYIGDDTWDIWGDLDPTP